VPRRKSTSDRKAGPRRESVGEALLTVKVPGPFEPVLAAAQAYVRRYFSDRQEHPEKGTISISGERYIRPTRITSWSTTIPSASSPTPGAPTRAPARFVGRGLAGFIQKPYRPETLVAAIRRALAD